MDSEQPFTPQRIALLKELWGAGSSHERIATVLDISVGRVKSKVASMQRAGNLRARKPRRR